MLPVLLAAEPGLLTGERLLGAGTADLWGHTWGTWWTAEALLQGKAPWSMGPLDHPRGQHWQVIDLPVPLALLPVSWLLGPVAALLGHSLLRTGLVGGLLALWLRGLGLSRAVSGLVTGLVLVSPFTRGILLSGVPEGLGVLLAAPFAWLLGRWLRGEGRPWGPVLLGLFCALDGIWGALAAGGLGTLVVLGALLRAPERARVLARALVAGAPAALALGTVVLAQRARGHKALALVSAPEANDGSDRWMVAPMGGIDVLGLVAWQGWLPEGPAHVDHRHLGYLGGLLLLLALGVALRAAGQPRRLVLLGLGALVLALGERLRVAGLPLVDLPLPGALLTAQGGQNIYRLAGLALVLLLAGTALGLPGRLRLPLLGLVGLDLLLAAPLRLPTTPNPAGAVEAWLAQGEGAVLDLPVEDDLPDSTMPHQHRSLFLQTAHGRPIASALFRDSLVEEEGIEAVVRLQRFATRASDGRGATLRRLQRDKAVASRQRLAELGFTAVSLDLGRLPEAHRERAASYLVEWLGPPAAEAEERLGWTLEAPP